jgi:hypothetical protein
MLDPAVTAKLEAEGWRVDWGGDALADALAAREEERGGGGSGEAHALADVRAALLDADLRKARPALAGREGSTCSGRRRQR